MTRFSWWVLGVVGLVLVVQVGRSQYQPTADYPAPAAEQTCVIYSLAEFGDDPELTKWIAETITEVIEPGTWHQAGTGGQKQVLRYYGPKQILVVYHTPAVQTKVDAFLKKMKQTLPGGTAHTTVAGKMAGKDPGVVRAKYQTPAPLPAANATPDASGGYPVPAASRPPRHLFHFIIRYEGEGVIDANVVKFMKAQSGSQPTPTLPAACVNGKQGPEPPSTTVVLPPALPPAPYAPPAPEPKEKKTRKAKEASKT